MNGNHFRDLVAYHEVLDHIELNKQNNSTVWKFRHNVLHQELFHHKDPNYKQFRRNALVEWKNGEVTSKPLNVFATKDPVPCATYAKDHPILELKRWKSIYDCIRKFGTAVLCFRMEAHDCSNIPDQVFNWSRMVYGNLSGVKPSNSPLRLGKPVVTTSHKDATLTHNLMANRSATGSLHFVNTTPVEWYSKIQSTVETVTDGSEFVSARTCVEQIIDLHNTLQYIGILVADQSFMFGDNQSTVDISLTPHASLNKRHPMLSFHKVREAIASKMIRFHHIFGSANLADIFSKHWSHASIWPQLQPILFFPGDTSELAKSYNHMDIDFRCALMGSDKFPWNLVIAELLFVLGLGLTKSLGGYIHIIHICERKIWNVLQNICMVTLHSKAVFHLLISK